MSVKTDIKKLILLHGTTSKFQRKSYFEGIIAKGSEPGERSEALRWVVGDWLANKIVIFDSPQLTEKFGT